jgi:hypothetical protein
MYRSPHVFLLQVPLSRSLQFWASLLVGFQFAELLQDEKFLSARILSFFARFLWDDNSWQALSWSWLGCSMILEIKCMHVLDMFCWIDTNRVLSFKLLEPELSWPAALGRRRILCRMLERVLYQVLAGYFSHYVKDMQREQFRVGVWKGTTCSYYATFIIM